MSHTRWRASLPVAAAVLIAAANVAAQETPPAAAPPAGAAAQEARDSVDLNFEREVFTYPAGPRRSPFGSLLAAAGEVRYDELTLRSIIYVDGDPSASVALLVRDPVGAEGATAQARRLRVGDTWGEVRVVEIRRQDIVVEVVVFGTVEQRIMRTPTRGQGGS